MDRLTELKNGLRAHQGVIAFFILLAAVTLSLYAAAMNNDRLEKEALARSSEQCAAQNEIRNVMISVMEDAIDTLETAPPPPEERTEEQNEYRQISMDFYQRAIDRLEPIDCPHEPPSIEDQLGSRS